MARGGLKDTRLEAKDTKKSMSKVKAKDTIKQHPRPKSMPRTDFPWTDHLEAKAKDAMQKCSSKKRGLRVGNRKFFVKFQKKKKKFMTMVHF